MLKMPDKIFNMGKGWYIRVNGKIEGTWPDKGSALAALKIAKQGAKLKTRTVDAYMDRHRDKPWDNL